MPTDRDPSNLGDRANPAPRGDLDPVACAPDPGVVEGVDQDCDGERCDDEESYVEPWTDYPDGRHRPWAEDHVEPAPQRVLDLLGAPEPDNDGDDVTPCWCGESNPIFNDEGLDATCDGSGTLICHCGGDLCVCHHHGETECPGCEHCAELEGDDDGPFEDGDELDGESGEACCHCGSTVDVGRYHGRWICDDCDDNEEDRDDV